VQRTPHELFAGLKQFCAVHGRQKLAAEALQVAPATLNGWLASGRPPRGWNQVARVEALLRAHQQETAVLQD